MVNSEPFPIAVFPFPTSDLYLKNKNTDGLQEGMKCKNKEKGVLKN